MFEWYFLQLLDDTLKEDVCFFFAYLLSPMSSTLVSLQNLPSAGQVSVLCRGGRRGKMHAQFCFSLTCMKFTAMCDCLMVICLLQVSYVLVQFDYFVCPLEYNETKESLTYECERAPVFLLTEYALPHFLQNICVMVGSSLLLVHNGLYGNVREYRWKNMDNSK